jgi:hypothetical protein
VIVAASGQSSPQLVHLFESVGTILIALGGVMSLVSIGVAGLMIMSSSGNVARAAKGVQLAKNSVIGLGVLAGGFFIRSILVRFITQADKAATQAQKPSAHSGSGISGTVLLTLVGIAASVAVLTFGANRVVRRRALVRLDQEILALWAGMMEPGVEGPFVPTEGFELLVPVKRQEVDATGAAVIRFIIALYRWADDKWLELDDEVTLADLKHVTRGGVAFKAVEEGAKRPRFVLRMLGQVRFKSALPSPDELAQMDAGQLLWPATTPIEELASEWFDFEERVRMENRLRWALMTDEQIEDQVRKEELVEELDVAELLPGLTTYDETTQALKEQLKAEQPSARHGTQV